MWIYERVTALSFGGVRLVAGVDDGRGGPGALPN